MALRHVVGMAAVTGGIVLCALLPFLPGRYESLAVHLSVLARVLGRAGLLLVPAGAAWLAYEISRRRAGVQAAAGRDRSHVFGIAALIAASLVGVVVTIAALAFSGPVLGVVTLALCALGIWTAERRMRHVPRADPRPALAMPLALVVVPVAVGLLHWATVSPMIESSRNRAMDGCAALIEDIERYRAAHGRYPASLLALWNDYPLSSIGIREYEYEPSGEAYNLCFEHPAEALDTLEIVMFNPLDQQVMTSHDSDLLRRTPEELEARRGFHAVHEAGRPHWKVFWFD